MREFLTGNQTIVRGALRAGCDYVAGDPITPAHSILTDFVHAFADGSGIVVQAEDEIAAIGRCIAASMCGARTLTATSTGEGAVLFARQATAGSYPLPVARAALNAPGDDGGRPFAKRHAVGRNLKYPN